MPASFTQSIDNMLLVSCMDRYMWLELNPKWIPVVCIWSIILGYGVYQVYFNPLAKHPGPFIAKFSACRATYHAWKGDMHLDIWKCHQKYGPVVRYSPNFVSFDTTSSLKHIYSTSPKIWKHRQFARLNDRAANLVTMYDKVEHAKRRRLVSPALNDTGMKNYEHRLLRHVKKFCNLLCPGEQQLTSDSWGPAMKMSDWCNYLAFDVITDFLFGMDYDLLGCEEYRQVTHHIEDASVRNYVVMFMPYLRLGRLDKILFRKSVKGTRKFWKFILRALQTHYNIASSLGNSAVSHLSAVDKVSGTKLADVAINSEVGTMCVAGFDTTSSALCAMMFYLSRNPYSYHKVVEEVRSTFSALSDIRLGPQLKSCNYLHACITETLRMSPPVGTCPWREVGTGGEVIDGHYIPDGSSVGTGIYSIHHNELYFPRPHEFIPERWLADSVDDSNIPVTADSGAYHPFSIGPRGCIGKPLALAEISLTISSLLWLYDIRAAEGPEGTLGAGHPLAGGGRTNPGEFQLLDRVVSLKEGPMIQFRRRHIVA